MGNLIAGLHVMLRVALIPTGLINHGDGEVCGRKRLGRGRHPSFSDGNLPSSFNPFTPGILRKVRFLNILVIIRLDLGQITFNPVENAFATQQLAFLATNIVF